MSRFSGFLAWIVLLACTSPALQATPVLSLSTNATPVMVGSTATVIVRIEGLGDFVAPSIGAFDLTLQYDPLILGNPFVMFGDPDPLIGDQLAFLFISITSIGSTLPLELAEVSLDDPGTLDAMQVDTFVLATIIFDALAPGTTSLSLTNVILSDSLGTELVVGPINGTSLDVQTPEPGTMAPVLFCLAGGGLIFQFSRRKRIGGRRGESV